MKLSAHRPRQRFTLRRVGSARDAVAADLDDDHCLQALASGDRFGIGDGHGAAPPAFDGAAGNSGWRDRRRCGRPAAWPRRRVRRASDDGRRGSRRRLPVRSRSRRKKSSMRARVRVTLLGARRRPLLRRCQQPLDRRHRRPWTRCDRAGEFGDLGRGRGEGGGEAGLAGEHQPAGLGDGVRRKAGEHRRHSRRPENSAASPAAATFIVASIGSTSAPIAAAPSGGASRRFRSRSAASALRSPGRRKTRHSIAQRAAPAKTAMLWRTTKTSRLIVDRDSPRITWGLGRRRGSHDRDAGPRARR